MGGTRHRITEGRDLRKRLVLFGLAAAFVLLLVPTAALADNGPHGGYTATNTPDGCAACHRAHTAQGEMLLVASDTYALCTSCHGSAAAGAQTNVIDGVYAEGVDDPGGEGTTAGGLRAGGFENTLMNTDFSLTPPGSRATTSAHMVNGGTGTVWGYGAISATPYEGPAGFELTCANCHNPHGNSGPGGEATYRLLRSSPIGPDGEVPVVGYVTDETTKTYTIEPRNQNIPDNYFYQTYSTPTGVAISAFCGGCHTRYEAPTGAYHIDSGDGLFTYRHPAGLDAHGSVSCLTCHTSHGTSAMGTELATSTSLADNTALLRLDNRGVCANCHNQQPQTLTSITPSSAAVGDAITIAGSNFGELGGFVYFGTTFDATTPHVELLSTDPNWSDTSITVTVPAGLAAGEVRVMVLPNGYRPSTRNISYLMLTVL